MIDDIPIYIEGDEVVERPRFLIEKDFVDYLCRLSEGRDMSICVEHPHTEDSNIIGVWIGCKPTYKCPKGCDA